MKPTLRWRLARLIADRPIGVVPDHDGVWVYMRNANLHSWIEAERFRLRLQTGPRAGIFAGTVKR